MHRFMLLIISLVMFAGITQAQEFGEKRAIGYLFVAPGGAASNQDSSPTMHFGGGGEYLIYKGLGAGAEIGALLPVGSSGCSCSTGNGIGLFSSNASYHFLNASQNRKLVPFVTAGYTGAFQSEWGESWFNFGGGADYWFRERAGLRVEFRDHVDPQHSEPIHFLEARVGFVW